MQKTYRFGGKSFPAFSAALAIASVVLLIALCMFGSARLSMEEVVRGALNRYFAIGEQSGNDGAIVNLRLMRTLMALSLIHILQSCTPLTLRATAC